MHAHSKNLISSISSNKWAQKFDFLTFIKSIEKFFLFFPTTIKACMRTNTNKVMMDMKKFNKKILTKY